MDNLFKELKTRTLLIWILISFLFCSLIFFLPFLKDTDSNLKSFINICVPIYITPILLIQHHLKKQGTSIVKAFFKKIKKIPVKETVFAFSLSMILSVGLFFILFSILNFFGDKNANGLTNILLNSDKSRYVLINLFASILIAPICEEILFRGFLLNRFISKYGLKKAIVFSSIIFGILHLGNAINAFIIGVIYSLLYLKTKNLNVTIFMHITMNILVTLFASFKILQISLPSTTLSFLFGISITLLCSFLLVLFVRKMWREIQSNL